MSRDRRVPYLARNTICARYGEVRDAFFHGCHLGIMAITYSINNRNINIDLRNDKLWIGAYLNVCSWIDDNVLWINCAGTDIGLYGRHQNAIVLQKRNNKHYRSEK